MSLIGVAAVGVGLLLHELHLLMACSHAAVLGLDMGLLHLSAVGIVAGVLLLVLVGVQGRSATGELAEVTIIRLELLLLVLLLLINRLLLLWDVANLLVGMTSGARAYLRVLLLMLKRRMMVATIHSSPLQRYWVPALVLPLSLSSV